jgi:3-phosphoshikimate 1-carboxyvinyltransferase
MTPLSGFAVVPRVARIAGRLRVPGDKSISHRYAMLAGIADGISRLHGYAPGADCASTLTCLEALGVRVERGAALTIHGRGLGGLRTPALPLDAANSGTSMRLLSGLLAAHSFQSVIGGDASLSRRPMRRVIEPLERMGARIQAVDGRPPLTIDGAQLRGITHTPDVPSAQVKSAVLLAGLHAAGRTMVVEPAPTRDHTERAFEAFGVRSIRDGSSVAVEGGQRLRAIDAAVPGDISSAVFWMALAAGTPGSDLVIEGVGLNPSRAGVLEVFRRAGANIEVLPASDDLRPQGRSYLKHSLDPTDDTKSVGSSGLQPGDHGNAGEPVGSLRIRYDELRSFEIAPDEVPGLIDEIPGLAALAAMQPGISMTVRGAQELRVKESDRITMLARGFEALGIAVEEYPDGFTIRGGPPAGGQADAAHDHRLAMAFAIAGSRARGPVHITGADAVAVSYPGFFDELERFSRGQ